MARKPSYEDLEQKISKLEKKVLEQKQANEALRDLRNMLQTVLDSVPAAVFWKDRNLNYLGGNRHWLEALGRKSIEEVIGKSDYDLRFEKEQADSFRKYDSRVIESGIPEYDIIEPYLRADGTLAWARTNKMPLLDEEGKVIGVLGTYKDITEYKQAEEELRKSEEKYRSLVESTEDSIYLVDRECRYLFMNKKHLSRFGMKANKVIGRRYKDFHSEQETREFTIKVDNVFKTGKPLSYEHRSKRAGGYFLRTLSPLKDPDGETTSVTVISKDITERKNSEEKLKRSEKELHMITENIPGLVSYVDATGCYRFVNKQYENWFGMSRKEIIGKHYKQVLGNSTYKQIKRYVEEALSGEQVHFEEAVPYKSGGTRWVNVDYVPDIDENGNVKGHFALVIDITKLKQAEELLRENEEFRSNLLDNSPNPIIVLNRDTSVRYVNLAFKMLTGFSAEELINAKAPYPWWKKESLDKNHRELKEAMSRGLWNCEKLFQKKNGESFWVEITSIPLKNNSGFKYHLANWVDITERRHAEEALRKSQEQLRNLTDHIQSVREEERTIIAREIHDELGQALTGLKMDFSWMAKRIPRDQTQLLDKLNSMSEYTGKTLRTVQRISTELRPGLLDDLGLAAAIEWQVEEFESRTGIRCKLTVDPKDITVDDDRRSTALFRILQETLTNVARHAQATIVHVSFKEKDGSLELRVKDNGKGITKEQSSNHKSFGIIGMKERVYLLGGKVRVSGRPGKGTTLVVEIPKID